MDLNRLNNLSQAEAFNAFEKCCASSTWVNHMVDALPFADEHDLFEKASLYWSQISFQDWLEACDGHPKIGDVSSLKATYASTKKWAAHEQKGMDEANDEVIKRLAKGNAVYEDKFGYIFIVCATGKSAEEMLDLLENRLDNDEENELEIAKGEQEKITTLRLAKLLS